MTQQTLQSPQIELGVKVRASFEGKVIARTVSLDRPPSVLVECKADADSNRVLRKWIPEDELEVVE
ncbi:hypothetical protein [Pseudaminobacter sp. NGMCC 1.201702]|uniref:hypothetical protein n=1 Tax=Pseudaminobacter sp. NGMCC 1.201702 TaxID=3391825 RepID=UPI0039F05C90